MTTRRGRTTLGALQAKVVYAPYLMPGRQGPVNMLFNKTPASLTTEDLLRLRLWHRAKTSKDRKQLLPYSKEEILRSKNLRRDLALAAEAVEQEIDRRFVQILRGAQARTVFKLGPLKQGEHVDPTRNQSIAMEVLRLKRLPGISEKKARELVGEKFNVDPDDVVARAVRQWRKDPRFSDAAVDRYTFTLRVHKFID